MIALHKYVKRNRDKLIIHVPLSLTTGLGDDTEPFGSMTIWYQADTDSAETSVTAVTMTEGTWVDSGWVEVGSSGVYQFGVPEAAIKGTSGNPPKTVTFHFISDDVAAAPTVITLELIRSIAH